MIHKFNYTDKNSCHKNSYHDFNISMVEEIVGGDTPIGKETGQFIIVKDARNRVRAGVNLGRDFRNNSKWQKEGGKNWKFIYRVKWLSKIVKLDEPFDKSCFSRWYRKPEYQVVLENLVKDILSDNI